MKQLTKEQKSEIKNLIKEINRDIKEWSYKYRGGTFKGNTVFASTASAMMGEFGEKKKKIFIDFLVPDPAFVEGGGWQVLDRKIYGATDDLISSDVSREFRQVDESLIRPSKNAIIEETPDNSSQISKQD